MSLGRVCSRLLLPQWRALRIIEAPKAQNILALRLPPMMTSTRTHIYDARDKDHEKKSQTMIVNHTELYNKLAQKSKDKRTYQRAVAIYLKHQGIQRRGHVEFIYASLEKMKDFGVHKDIEVYKQLIDLFPKGKMVAKSVWDTELMVYPKQQQCLIDLLDTMESNGVIPDDDIGYKIIDIFNKNTHPFRKYQRMMYWMPKFKYANPYYIPHQLPDDRIELAKMALKRMSVDLENRINVFDSADIKDSIEPTFIVSAQSPAQRQLITDHPTDVPLYVVGGHMTWLRDQALTYFVLQAEQTESYKAMKRHEEEQRGEDEDDDKEDILQLTDMFEREDYRYEVAVVPSVHEQEDGTILSMCITGTNSKESLASWVKSLQDTNSRLKDIPIVFLLKSPETGLQIQEEDRESLVLKDKDVNR